MVDIVKMDMIIIVKWTRAAHDLNLAYVTSPRVPQVSQDVKALQVTDTPVRSHLEQRSGRADAVRPSAKLLRG